MAITINTLCIVVPDVSQFTEIGAATRNLLQT